MRRVDNNIDSLCQSNMANLSKLNSLSEALNEPWSRKITLYFCQSNPRHRDQLSSLYDGRTAVGLIKIAPDEISFQLFSIQAEGEYVLG